MLSLDIWMNKSFAYEPNKDCFYRLVDTFGIKIPIIAAQKTFMVGEFVYLTFPPYVLNRYRDTYDTFESMGKGEILAINEDTSTYGFKTQDGVIFWLPCFFFHRNSQLAKDTYRKQIDLMIQVARKEEAEGVSRFNKTYCVPSKMLNSRVADRDSWFYEQYDKSSIADLKKRTKALGF